MALTTAFLRVLIIIFEMNLTCANYSLLNIGVDYFKELQQSQKPSNSSVCTGAAGLNSQKDDDACWGVFKGSFRLVHLYHHSSAHDNRGQQFASCNFSRRSTQDFPQPNQLLSHRFGHRGSPNSTDTRTYLCHLFHADVLSASFVDEMWTLDEICSVFFGISNLNIGIHRFCLYIDAVYRGGIASEVRPHDYKEESFH